MTGKLLKLCSAAALAAAISFAQDPPTGPAANGKAMFEGYVQDSVSRLPPYRSTVRLTPVDPKLPSYLATTDPYGTFRFEAIEPGEYRILVKARGFNDGESVALLRGRSTSVLTFAAGQQITAAAVILDPENVLVGRITDATGVPLPGARVSAVAEQWQDGIRIFQIVAGALADQGGMYRFKLPPGRYYLSAGPPANDVVPSNFAEDPGKPEMRVAQVFHPNAISIESAAPVTFIPGQQSNQINFQLPTVVTHRVRGAVKPWVSSTSLSVAILVNRNGDRSTRSGVTLKKDGSFDIKGVMPGNYWLEVWPPGPRPSGRIEVTVADKDLDGVVIPGIQPFELKGRVRVDGESAEPITSAKLRIQMLNYFEFNVAMNASPAADGAIRFLNLQTGTYVLTAVPGSDFYISSISYNQREVEGGKLDLTHGAAGDIEVVLGTGTGTVDGIVRWPMVPLGAPVRPTPGLTAVLVSKDGQTSNTGARSAAIGLSGGFQFQFVPPGRYLVFAAAKFDPGLWQNMDFVHQVESRGTAIEVAKKGTAQADLSILSVEEIQDAVARLPR